MRRYFALGVLMSMAIGCSRKPASPPASAGVPGGAVSAGAGAAGAPAASTASEEDLAAFASGALIVQEPDPDSIHAASWLLRGPYEQQWNWEVEGAATNRAIVIELPERSLVKQLEFDTAMVTGGSAKDIKIEMSDTSAKEGFNSIADVSLQDRVDNQVFPVGAQAPGRWIRLNIKNGYASNYLGINRFRARGTRLTDTPFPNVSGTYASRNGKMYIRQDGTSVVGCYEEHGGTLEGGIDGRVMKLTWHEKEPASEGAAFMVFSGDAQRWAGLYSYKGEDPNTGRFWTGTKSSTAVGTCPGWAGGIEQQMTKDIEEFGRARVYGINFDSDSARIREESRPTLDHVASMLKARAQWNITIEGHTDSTASAQHNQELSERRASAVGEYLVNAGITASRLNAVGYGATKPVSTNDTALGRAQNRRVELVKR
jgi:OmpA-OmpF porin, OOP family